MERGGTRARIVSVLVALSAAGCGDEAATPGGTNDTPAARAPQESVAPPATPASDASGASITTPASSEVRASGLAGALAGQDCLVILLDALHAAHLGTWGGRPEVSPRIDALAADGVRARHAWSPSSWTLPSTVSLFTGLYQETHGMEFGVVRDAAELGTKRLSDEALTMAELFRQAGYATACYTQNPWTGRSYGLDQGFDVFEEVRTDRGTEQDWFLAGRVAESLAAPDDRPRFTYVHFRRPHTPFDPPDEILARFADPSYDGDILGTDEEIEAHNSQRAPMDAADRRHHLDRYLGNIHQADRCVGRILDAIDRERTLVVILSDHGEAFAQHERFGHNWQSYEEYVHVPLVLAHPSLPRGASLDGRISTLDVLPTLADLFALPLPPQSVQGHSLVPALQGDEPTRTLQYTSARLDGRGQRQMAVFDGRFKYMRQHPAGREWLFDLVDDPLEQRDVSADHPEDAARLRAALGAWFGSQRPTLVEESGPVELDADAMDELRRLGYLGDTEGSDDDDLPEDGR